MITMSFVPLLGWILLSGLCGPVWAQWVQNADIYFMAGPATSGSMTVPGSTATVNESTNVGQTSGYGYQLARMSSGSIWLDIAPTFVLGSAGASIPGGVAVDFMSLTAGLRFMIPVQSRISIYGALGGGVGSFHYPGISGGTPPYVLPNSATHGVFQCAGGVDFRLTERFSLRGEARDVVTGSGLSGSSGPHHLVPLMGVALHF